VRPWTTPESLGDGGVTATFDATLSLDETSTSTLQNTNITDYTWKVDGVTEQTGTSKTFDHVFSDAGSYEVSLTVTTAGGTDTVTKTYRVTGDSGTGEITITVETLGVGTLNVTP
jgi:PKD repeat protein